MTNNFKVKPSELKALAATVVVATILSATNAYALTMPWESPIRQVLDSLSGTTAQLLVIGGIVVTALTFIWGEGGGVFRAGVRILAGGAVAIGASSLASQIFSF